MFWIIALLFVAMGFSVGLFSAVTMHRPGTRRGRALIRVAETMAYTYEAVGRSLVKEWFIRFPLFRTGHAVIPQNVLRGTYRNTDFVMFDFEFTQAHHRRQTVVAFPLKQSQLPNFILWPRSLHLRHEIGINATDRQIDLTGTVRFPQRYELFAHNRDAMHDLFTPRVQKSLDRLPECCAEGGGTWVIVYRFDQLVAPRHVDDHLRSAWQVYRALRVQ